MGICVKDLKYVVSTVLGCELENDGDHVRYSLKVNGRFIANLKFSRSWTGNYQIGEFILHKQAQSMHCPLQLWKGLLTGRIPKRNYFDELLKQELISQSEYEMLCKR